MDRIRTNDKQNRADADLTERMRECNLRDVRQENGSCADSVAKDTNRGATSDALVEKSVSVTSMQPGPLPGAVLTDVLAIDCEGVGIGPRGKINTAARVSIVNEYGHCVYDMFVKQSEPVTDYRTWLTGIEKKHLENGRDAKEVRSDVRNVLKGRKLVGHALHNDFRMLRYWHPENLIRDTSTYDPFRCLAQQCHPSLKTLANLVLGLTIQDGLHDSVVDARTAMQLYQKHKKVWEASEYGWPELPLPDTNPITKKEIDDRRKWL